LLKELESIRDRIVSFIRLITDPKGTAFTMVLVPEKMAIVDTERALEMFEELGLKMSGGWKGSHKPGISTSDTKGSKGPLSILRRRSRLKGLSLVRYMRSLRISYWL